MTRHHAAGQMGARPDEGLSGTYLATTRVVPSVVDGGIRFPSDRFTTGRSALTRGEWLRLFATTFVGGGPSRQDRAPAPGDFGASPTQHQVPAAVDHHRDFSNAVPAAASAGRTTPQGGGRVPGAPVSVTKKNSPRAAATAGGNDQEGTS